MAESRITLKDNNAGRMMWLTIPIHSPSVVENINRI
jgi:hypothetical protein